jgi:hypothetical protein
MSVTIFTPGPAALLEKVRKAIDSSDIKTWSYDANGDFTHSPEQWKHKAWLRPSVQQGMLVFGLVGRKDATMSKTIYGVYHGRFVEMLLTHFDDQFTNVSSTALCDSVVDVV